MDREHVQRDFTFLYNNRWLRNQLLKQHIDIQSEFMSTEYDRDLYQVAAEVERRINIQRGNYKYEEELSDTEDDEDTLSVDNSDMEDEIIDIMGDDEVCFSETTESTDSNFDINSNIIENEQSFEVDSDVMNSNQPASDIICYNPLYQLSLIVESVNSR